MARIILLAILSAAALFALTACDARQPDATPTVQADMPNPAAVFCRELGNEYEIRTAEDGSQFGVCILPDGIECDEWAYFRGECPEQEAPDTPEAGLPNPASVFCEQNGGTVEFRIGATGGTAGICIFPDGSECEEWAFMRGECAPGAETGATTTPAVELADDGWLVYRNDSLGYTLHYPPDAIITDVADEAQAYTIQGPLVADDYWPMIFVSHRQDQEAFLPQGDIELGQWLIEHNLISPADQQPAAEIRQPDVVIAGIPALHTRFDRSPQSYAYDKYFFVHEGQLYMLLLMHTGDREDWLLYNRFLESFRFEE